MNIKGFKIKNQKIQKLWFTVGIAIIIAIILIITTFFLIFRKSSQIKYDNENLFGYTSYYAKYNITTYSNKNQNTYSMEEYCMKKSNDVKFRFNTLNKDNNFSYIITNDSFHIKSNNQINELKNSSNFIANTNILSLSTFIDIYLKINKMIEENILDSNSIKLGLEEVDNKIFYSITFIQKSKISNEMSAYKEQLINGMGISKMQLILDINTKKPVEYIIFLKDDKAYIDISYDEVKINTKFDEKVFSF